VATGPHRFDAQLLTAALVALSAYAAHVTRQLINDRPGNLLWACHVAVALVGVGALLRLRGAVAVGTLVLAVGLPLWAIDVAVGGEFFWTSVLTHFGGLGAGLIALRRLGGLPRLAWRHAMLAVALLIAISRLATAPAENVNLAFRAWGPFTAWFPEGPSHFFFLLAEWGLLLALAELAVRRVANGLSENGDR
jgi:hypothetical protein